ncbi:helix-turn-helix domain-containing protein [Acinetobacter sp. CAAS 2-6]|uniref:helix-turn-helix domain-containing protein n=1 Tax=Acinetobacter sp. CAAS 2-6 TaxID=3016358 RepID=UPI002DD6611B|nr:helix-turn-helix domain-containing protein [Acinetobacter sp. CAAS 2-6]
MKSNQHQYQQVLTHLKQGQTISQAEAIELFGCYRLSAIINRLRNLGYYIVTHHEPNKTNKGNHARYEYIGGEK